jgi:hypothetical protein
MKEILFRMMIKNIQFLPYNLLVVSGKFAFYAENHSKNVKAP